MKLKSIYKDEIDGICETQSQNHFKLWSRIISLMKIIQYICYFQ